MPWSTCDVKAEIQTSSGCLRKNALLSVFLLRYAGPISADPVFILVRNPPGKFYVRRNHLGMSHMQGLNNEE